MVSNRDASPTTQAGLTYRQHTVSNRGRYSNDTFNTRSPTGNASQTTQAGLTYRQHTVSNRGRFSNDTGRSYPPATVTWSPKENVSPTTHTGRTHRQASTRGRLSSSTCRSYPLTWSPTGNAGQTLCRFRLDKLRIRWSRRTLQQDTAGSVYIMDTPLFKAQDSLMMTEAGRDILTYNECA